MGETPKRILSGLSIAAAFIFSISWQHWYMLPLYIFVLVCGIIATLEFYRMAEAKTQVRLSRVLGVTFAVLWITLVYFAWQAAESGGKFPTPEIGAAASRLRLNFALLGGVIFALVFFVFLYQLLQNRIENSFSALGSYILGFIYIPFTFAHLFLLYSLQDGLFYVWLVGWATTMSDTASYFMGKAFGRHKVGFAVSPNKTYEGYILGLLLQVVLVLVFYAVANAYFRVPQYGYAELAGFAVVIYLGSILGDLTESLIKRDANFKDSGNLIPGHGGMLDLLDALMVTIPAAYYYFYIVQELRGL
ncbi:MAG: phosphatidate cytidylyltransferase [Turneriella sp.]|nr:phosphatidate cytidylyltransferase [Leptospiraceae bacterium]MCX7633019.1 phosphatidate cytidylyltransferase [Turneriella sp.]